MGELCPDKIPEKKLSNKHLEDVLSSNMEVLRQFLENAEAENDDDDYDEAVALVEEAHDALKKAQEAGVFNLENIDRELAELDKKVQSLIDINDTDKQ